MKSHAHVWCALPAVCLPAALAIWSLSCTSRENFGSDADGDHTENPGEAVIRSDGRLPWVDTLVSGKHIRLVIDTGGDASQIPHALADRLPMISQGQSSDANGSYAIRTVGPASLRVGTAVAYPVEFVTRGDYLTPISGGGLWKTDVPTLGINALSHFRVIITGEKLSLTCDQDVKGSGWIPFTGFWGSSHLVVPSTVNGHSVEILIDTGLDASRCITSLASADGEVALTIGDQRIVMHPLLLAGESEKQFTMTKPDGAISTITTHATLGWDVLCHCRLEVSYRHHQLRLTADTLPSE